MDNKAINKVKEVLYKNMSYTNQDFESIISEMVSIVRSGELPTHWDNLTETDPITMLLAVFAAHKDILNYMVDYRIMESYMATARETGSVIRIADSYGYKIPGYSAARVQYEIPLNTLEQGKTYTLLPFETSILDVNGIHWTYVGEWDSENGHQPLEIEYASSGTKVITLYQGKAETLTFLGKDIDNISKTRIIGASSIAFSNTWDNVPVVSLVYNGDTQFKYVDLNTTLEQGHELFELGIDVTEMVYIKFLDSLRHEDGEFYSGEFTLRVIRTLGNYNITPHSTMTIPIEIAEGSNSSTTTHIEVNYVDNSYNVGRDIYTVDQIKEDFKNYYGSIRSLVTVRDYYNYIKNVQRVVPNISKVYVLDKQTDSSGGDGHTDIDNLNVAIYVTTYDASTGEHNALGPAEITALQNDIKLIKITGIDTFINENGEDSPNHKPLVTKPITIDIDGAIDPAMYPILKKAIKDLLLSTNIGALLTVTDITNMLYEKDLMKYFGFGATIKFAHTGGEHFSQQLNYNEYIGKADEITINMPS